jgi:Fur family ferric uptake transcriptional regulator
MDVHERIAAEFEQVFIQDGFGHIDDRKRILEAFLRHEDHVTAERMAKEFADEGASMEPVFIERVLEQFVRCGLALPILGEDGRTRFEHVHIGRHHDHIICVSCGRITEVQCSLDKLVGDLSRRTGYRALHAHLQIHGLCPSCVAARPARFPLTRAAAGERVRVVEVTGGPGMFHRLGGLGLYVGAIVRRQNAAGDGPLIVSIGPTRLALGQGMADRVIVEQLRVEEREGA